MRQFQTRLDIGTDGPGLTEITGPVNRWVAAQGIEQGILTLFIRHTSASLVIQENADPDVLADLTDFFEHLAPASAVYRHDAEGPDDMPAHIKAALTQCQLSVPLDGGRLLLGTWQGISVFEHRDQPHRRQIALHLLGA